jgi:hypothetical protein
MAVVLNVRREFVGALEAPPCRGCRQYLASMNNVRQHKRSHRTVVRVTAALVASVAVEVVALNAGITDNILWPPTTRRRGLMLIMLLLPWVPVTQDVVERIGNRRQAATPIS